MVLIPGDFNSSIKSMMKVKFNLKETGLKWFRGRENGAIVNAPLNV
jgi:hypothetical protein